jgi:hypothetical protein
LPHALRRAEWPLLGRRQSAAGQAMKGRSGSTAATNLRAEGLGRMSIPPRQKRS